MSNVIYLNAFVWTFEQKAQQASQSKEDRRSGAKRADAERAMQFDVMSRFPSFEDFVTQLVEDLSATEEARQHALELARLEEEQVVLSVARR